MNKLAVILFITAASVCAAFSQTPQPSPTPPPADDTDVVKITTALIQLDVTVTDRKGRIITDLKPHEIEIFENGEKQEISNFSFVSNFRVGEVDEKKKIEKNPLVLPSPPIKLESVRRSIALVVDDLTLSFESIYNVRRAARKFVDQQMQEGDLVAIIRTGAGIGALQQFTSDKRQLYAAVEKIRWNSSSSGGIGSLAPLEERFAGQEVQTQPGGRAQEGDLDDFRRNLMAMAMLEAVSYIVRGMQDLPGRKSIMLLSDGFPLRPELLEKARRLADAANRASVVLYTMDARGLLVGGLTAADDPGGRTPQQLDRELSSRNSQITENQDGLRYLAKQTGGTALYNNNDLSGGIRKILDDQSYYLVAYQPDDATFDPRTARFNKIEIKVTRPGTDVRYRSGFFGVSDETRVSPVTQNQRLRHALTSPFAVNGIALRLNALFYGGGKDAGVIRALVHIKTQDLKFTDEADGTKKAIFDLVAAGFGDNGSLVDLSAKTYTMTLEKPAYERALRQGFVYDFSFPIKKPGAYQLRVALRDRGNDKLGSTYQFVEVPNLDKNRLVLSGVALENIEYGEWQKRRAGEWPRSDTADAANALVATSMRQFKRGTVLNYGFAIYNAKQAGAANNLSYQTRIFRDGKPIFETAAEPVPADSKNPMSTEFSGSLALGTSLAPGDYVLQIVIIDNLAKAGRNAATQFVQFEIIED